MFALTYLRRELGRRLGRTIVTALGLALGVGLVIGIIGVGQGLDEAQGDVLAPLGSVGTDILVTRVIGAGDEGAAATEGTTATTAAPGPSEARGGRGFFGAGPGGGGTALNQEDAAALLEENRNVVTDLAQLGEPGETFTRDFFLSATLLSFPDEAVADIAALDSVASATGGLVQLAQHQTGTVPEIVAEIQTGGETFTQTVRPEPMTEAERQAFQACLAARGVTIAPPPEAGGGDVQGNERRQVGPAGPGPAFDDCMPERFREFRAQFVTPMQTLRQIVDPPTTDIQSESWTAAGVDPATPDVGLVTRQQLAEGAWLPAGAGDQVLLNVAYANANGLSVGSTLPVNGTDYEVVGLVRPTLTGSTADVYFPLATLQALAGKEGRVTQVLVKVDGADAVGRVAARIAELLPGAEIVTTEQLADDVTGSLADAGALADRLGGALATIVLVAAFAIAVLLTLSSIAKRVREIGTLRAIGWSR
ncbi:MAG TPA: ABC transporter permease, partial [Acidimicrobiales bacterium]|nr:ABC transporter permease [Acidimicrobiales bacterium]